METVLRLLKSLSFVHAHQRINALLRLFEWAHAVILREIHTHANAKTEM